MTDDRAKRENAPLNPNLQARTDETHGTERTAAPLETTHAHVGAQGEGWSWTWLIVLLICVALTIYLFA